MAATRLGCSFCFATLDPNDAQQEQRLFMACTKCTAHYHKTCWENTGLCVECRNSVANLVGVPAPKPLQAARKTSVVPFLPSSTYPPKPVRRRRFALPRLSRRGCFGTAIVAVLLIGWLFQSGRAVPLLTGAPFSAIAADPTNQPDPTLPSDGSDPATPTVVSEAPTDPPPTDSPPAAPSAAERAEVNTAQLNVRSGPGPDFSVVARIELGDTVEILQSQPVGNATWSQIRIDDGGQEGWVNDRFLTRTP